MELGAAEVKKVGWVLPHVSGEGFCGWDRCCPGEPHGALCESTGISHPASHTACICPVEGVTALSWIRQRGDVYESTVTAVRGYLANAADGEPGEACISLLGMTPYGQLKTGLGYTKSQQNGQVHLS